MRDLQTKCFRQDVRRLEFMGGEDGGKCVDKAGVGEVESGGGKPGGVGAGAGEEDFTGHFAEGEAEGEGGDGEKRGAMELGQRGRG
jgi:hypothetical protein